MKKKVFSYVLVFMLILTTFIMVACGKEAYRTIKVYSTTGTVKVERESSVLDAKKDMKLKSNDTVKVESESKTVLKLDSDKFIMVKENTTIHLEATGSSKNTKTRILVDKGGIIVEIKEKLKETESFDIASSNTLLAIRGTQVEFNVDLDDTYITTQVAILEGLTNVLLFKDNELYKTSLNKDQMITYKSTLTNITPSDILKLMDENKVKDITDSELEETFNIKKEAISNEIIDEMAEAVNSFDKKENKMINGTICLSIPVNFISGQNPDERIGVRHENEYVDFVNVVLKYSSSPDGPFVPYSEIGDLTPGVWYVKASADNAYDSRVYTLNVASSSASSNIVLSISGNVPYTIDPKTLITLDQNIGEYELVYSSSINGEFKPFNSNDPFDLGTWYCKLNTTGYESNVLEFTVSEKALNIDIDYSQIVNGGYGMVDAKFATDEFFTTDLAQTPAVTNNGYSNYEYYIKITAIDAKNPDLDPIISVLDYDNRDVIFNNAYYCCEKINIVYDYVLPTGFTVDKLNDTYNFNYEYNYYGAFVKIEESDSNKVHIYTMMDAYATDADLEVSIYTKNNSDTDFTLLESKPLGDYCFELIYDTFDGLSDLSQVMYKIENTNDASPDYGDVLYESDPINIDFSNIIDSSGNEITSMGFFSPSESIVTYNEDETINLYMETQFSTISDRFYQLIILQCFDEKVGMTRYHHSVGAKRYAIFEDLPDQEYHCYYGATMQLADGVYYECSRPSNPDDNFNRKIGYGTYDVSGSSVTLTSNEYFIKDGSLKITDICGNNVTNVETSDFTSNYGFTKEVSGYENNKCYISGNVYGYISEYASGYMTTTGGFTDEIFESVSSRLADYDITVKGSNVHYVDRIEFEA